MGRLFGTDGIRGKANEYPMTAETALRAGRAIARVFRRKGGTTSIIIGKDTRMSGPMLEHALISGICSMGGNALLAGILPTPGVAFMTKAMGIDAGVVISASHNPYQDNGIKIFGSDGFKLSDETEREIEGLILEEERGKCLKDPDSPGRTYAVDDARERYVAFLRDAAPGHESLQGMRVVLDCANGATFQAAPSTFRELGVSVNTLFAEPDGRNINLNCGSEHPERLSEEVVATKADVGLAFDGDGDRVIAVDETGKVVRGGQILAICAKVMKGQGRLRNNLVVSTVMSNIGMKLALKGLGIDCLTTQVGDRHVLHEMLASGACIGGEDSGHMIFLDHHTTGDGIITALQLICAMKQEAKPLSRLAGLVRIFPQRLVNIEVKEKPDLESVPEIVSVIEGVERELGDKGRVLVRYSGTQPMCRVMVEGPTDRDTEEYCRRIAEVIKRRLG